MDLSQYMDQRKRELAENPVPTQGAMNEMVSGAYVPDDIKIKAMAALANKVKSVMIAVDEKKGVAPSATPMQAPSSESTFGAPLNRPIGKQLLTEMPEREDAFEAAMMKRTNAAVNAKQTQQYSAPVNPIQEYANQIMQKQSPSLDHNMINEIIDKRFLNMSDLIKEVAKETLKDVIVDMYVEEKIRSVVKDYLITLQKSKK
jgi:hypothetical protein